MAAMRDMSGQLAHKLHETKEEAAARLDQAKGRAMLEAKEARRQATYAWRDTREFVKKHPLVVLGLLTSAIMLGTPLARTLTHTLSN